MERIFKYFKVAWIAINENRGRALLTMLGIIIGVAAVVLMTSLGRGAESLILGSVSSFGSNLLYINSGSPAEGLTGAIISVDRVKYRDYLNLRKVDFLENVTPFLTYDAIAVAGEENEKTQVVGTTRGYSQALNFYTQKGRFIEDFDVSSSARIAVLGYKLSDKLFGDQDPIGQDIKIKGLNFRIVGIMEEQGGNAFENYDDMMFIPVTTLQTYLFGVDYLHTIMAQSKGGDITEAIVQTRDVMRRLHNIDNPENDPAKDDFQIMSQDQAVGIFTSVSSVLTLFIVMIASISLLVGGIGIMNIMFVSVNQRTREIGLRKAVGATRADILLQFLIEAVMLTFIGGLLGVLAGVGISFLLSQIIVRFQSTWQFLINEQALLIALLVSVLVGIVFGLYPARKASRLNPIEALRYE